MALEQRLPELHGAVGGSQAQVDQIE